MSCLRARRATSRTVDIMRPQMLAFPVVLSISAIAAAIVASRTGHHAVAFMALAPACGLALMTYLAIEFGIIRSHTAASGRRNEAWMATGQEPRGPSARNC
jgi:hypothetical protein